VTDLDRFKRLFRASGDRPTRLTEEKSYTEIEVNLTSQDDHTARRRGDLTVLEFDSSGRLIRWDGRTVGPWSQKARLKAVLDEAGVEYDDDHSGVDSTITVEVEWTNGDGRPHFCGDHGCGAVFLFDLQENLAQIGGYEYDRVLSAGTKDIDEDDPCALCQDEVLPWAPSDCPDRDCAETITDIDEDDSDQS